MRDDVTVACMQRERPARYARTYCALTDEVRCVTTSRTTFSPQYFHFGEPFLRGDIVFIAAFCLMTRP